MVNHPVHFEIPTDDLARGKRFYETVFGWRIKPFTMPNGMQYYTVYARDEKLGIGLDGGMLQRKHPSQPFMQYIHVDSIDATIAKVKAQGGSVCMPKMEIMPGMGWIAGVMDTERNMIGLHEGGPEVSKVKTVKERTAMRDKILAKNNAKNTKALAKKAVKKPAKKVAKKKK